MDGYHTSTFALVIVFNHRSSSSLLTNTVVIIVIVIVIVIVRPLFQRNIYLSLSCDWIILFVYKIIFSFPFF